MPTEQAETPNFATFYETRPLTPTPPTPQERAEAKRLKRWATLTITMATLTSTAIRIESILKPNLLLGAENNATSHHTALNLDLITTTQSATAGPDDHNTSLGLHYAIILAFLHLTAAALICAFSLAGQNQDAPRGITEPIMSLLMAISAGESITHITSLTDSSPAEGDSRVFALVMLNLSACWTGVTALFYTNRLARPCAKRLLSSIANFFQPEETAQQPLLEIAGTADDDARTTANHSTMYGSINTDIERGADTPEHEAATGPANN
jgi:hypothetical protein